MQQRDIIQDQIEQLGRALGKLIANFLGVKSEGNLSVAIQITDTDMLSGLDIDVDRLVQLEANELTEYLESKHLTDLNLDQLSNYIFEIGLYKKSSYL